MNPQRRNRQEDFQASCCQEWRRQGWEAPQAGEAIDLVGERCHFQAGGVGCTHHQEAGASTPRQEEEPQEAGAMAAMAGATLGWFLR